MKRTPQQPLERAHFDLDLATVKELWRDLLFREAGQPYFKRFAVPRQRRWLGPWRTPDNVSSPVTPVKPQAKRDLPDQHAWGMLSVLGNQEEPWTTSLLLR